MRGLHDAFLSACPSCSGRTALHGVWWSYPLGIALTRARRSRRNRGLAHFGLLTDCLPLHADAGGSNLGSLRSAMSLTLHTHHASRIWHGRAAAEGRPGIVGLNGYIAVMNKMKRGSEQDDPYSDWWMLRIEEKLDQTRTTLQSLREQVDQALATSCSGL